MSINRNKTLEDQIRKLKRDMSAILRRLDQMEERMDKRFNGLETEIKDFKNKTGRSFLALTNSLENHCDGEGVEASRKLKKIWKNSVD